MVQYIEKYKRNIAIDMRRRGLTYSDIQNKLNVPRSTLSFWLRPLKLTDEEFKKLKKRRDEVFNYGQVLKKNRYLENLNRIKSSSSCDIKGISKKELWLMGIILYWKERLLHDNNSDIKRGVRFTSSDPYLIKLFLLWLKKIGGIIEDDIRYDIFINRKKASPSEIKKIISYWAEVICISEDKFKNVYFYGRKKKLKAKPSSSSLKSENATDLKHYGLVRVRVTKSSFLAKQIGAWVLGIVNCLLK